MLSLSYGEVWGSGGVFFLQLTHVTVKLNYPLINEIQKIVLKSRKFHFILFYFFLFAKYWWSGLHPTEPGKIWGYLLKTIFSTRLISTSSLKINSTSFRNALLWFNLRLWKMWSWKYWSSFLYCLGYGCRNGDAQRDVFELSGWTLHFWARVFSVFVGLWDRGSLASSS